MIVTVRRVPIPRVRGCAAPSSSREARKPFRPIARIIYPCGVDIEPKTSEPAEAALNQPPGAEPRSAARLPDIEGGEGIADGSAGPLGHIPLFTRLKEDEQATLLGLMRREEVPAHHCVFWLGDTGDSFYLIDKGRVAVTVPNDQGEHVTVNTLGPGSFFGEISLLDAGPRTATIRTMEPTGLLVLSRAEFHAFLRRRPAVAVEILSVMGQRQRASTEALRGLSNPNAVFEATRFTRWQRISDAVAAVAASQYFTAFHLAWFGVWIILNLLGEAGLASKRIAFDPFPFGLLTMVVSLEAIFLSIFVMVSQNRQSEKDRLRTDLDYQVNVKAQTEIVQISRRLEKIEEAIAVRKQEGR